MQRINGQNVSANRFRLFRLVEEPISLCFGYCCTDARWRDRLEFQFHNCTSKTGYRLSALGFRRAAVLFVGISIFFALRLILVSYRWFELGFPNLSKTPTGRTPTADSRQPSL